MISDLLDLSHEQKLKRIMDESVCAAAIGNKQRSIELWLEVCRLHRERSKAQVDKMEREMGLK